MKRRAFLLFIGFLAAGMVTGCSDDPASPQPTGTSKITVLHANPGFTSDVVVKVDDETKVSALSYGEPETIELPNGNKTVVYSGTDGIELTSAQIQMDSTKSGWVVFSGNSTKNEAFSIRNEALSFDAGSENAAIRVVHASETAPAIKVLLNDKNGLAVTEGSIPYKSASQFRTVAVATTQKFVIVDNSNSDVLLEVPLTALEKQKHYTVVVYGSTKVTNEFGLTAKLINDPQ